MPRWLLSPRARADLDAIWDYTARTWDANQAERYIRLIQTAVERIAADPELATRCDEIRPGYRRFRTGSHVLFCRATAEALEIIRILHERMDVERHI